MYMRQLAHPHGQAGASDVQPLSRLPSSTPPRFFVFPTIGRKSDAASGAETDLGYFRRLLACGASQAAACSARVRPQQPCDPVIAKQLRNPVAHDLRGGLGAEAMLCSAASSHPQRVTTVEAAEVVLLCPQLNYHELLGPGVGRGPPRCAVPDVGFNASARLARMARAVRSSSAWAASRPHVYMTNAEFATDSYSKGGHPFGFPAPGFVLHANADRWPFGLGGQHLIVPYMPAADLLSARARAIADARADRPAVPEARARGGASPGTTGEGPGSSSDRELLLYFRGTLDFGSARARLGVLTTLGWPQVIFDTQASRATLGADAWIQRSNRGYAESMLRSTFCLIASGHTCQTRRFFDAVAAGCLPLLVDCPTSVRPFDERVHYPGFTLYYPLERIVERPIAFVRCLHALQTEPQHREKLRRWRKALQAARRELIYGWYDPLPPANASLGDSMWADAPLSPGRVLDNVLMAAVTDPTQRAAPRNHWERRSRASQAHGLPGDAERMRAHSLEAFCSKATGAR